jgi:hypothetical protein
MSDEPHPGGQASEQARAFRRLPRQHARLDGLDLYSRIVGRSPGPIGDQGRIDEALADLRLELIGVTGRDSTLDGWRAQALFEAIVASLGRVQLLKLEDAGDVFFSGDDLKPPDFRIITEAGAQILVEVKNFHQSQPSDDFRIRCKDLEALRRYSHLVGIDDLKFAVYWTRWNRWSLTDAFLFQPDSPTHLSLSLPDAMKANEMGSVGDRIPATEWPIGLTFFSDPTQDRHVDERGEAQFTIGGVEYSVAGRVVTKTVEQKIVHRLMLYGGWSEETDAEIVDAKLISTSFMFSPDEPPPPPQTFAMHNPLSSIFSVMFNQATIGDDGEITALRIDIDPRALASLIPDDYEGEVLQVWRFTQTLA